MLQECVKICVRDCRLIEAGGILLRVMIITRCTVRERASRGIGRVPSEVKSREMCGYKCRSNQNFILIFKTQPNASTKSDAREALFQ